MLNEVILVGKIVKIPEISKTNTGTVVTNVILETVRHYKNSFGIYESDFIEITVWRGMAQTLVDGCELGSIIAVKGRIQTRTYAQDEKRHSSCLEIIAEKITILDSYFCKK